MSTNWPVNTPKYKGDYRLKYQEYEHGTFPAQQSALSCEFITWEYVNSSITFLPNSYNEIFSNFNDSQISINAHISTIPFYWWNLHHGTVCVPLPDNFCDDSRWFLCIFWKLRKTLFKSNKHDVPGISKEQDDANHHFQYFSHKHSCWGDVNFFSWNMVGPWMSQSKYVCTCLYHQDNQAQVL